MSYLFDVGSPREFHESESQCQEALQILRKRKLTKVSFEQDWSKNGSRLAPAIDILRNGWGFEIAGQGTRKDPYWMLNPAQFPTRVRTSPILKERYYESEHWKEVRQKRYEHDNYRCVVCVGACRGKLECHHLTYRLFAEAQDELLTVCEEHHKLIHDNCRLAFPVGVELWVAERLLEVATYEFEAWLQP